MLLSALKKGPLVPVFLSMFVVLFALGDDHCDGEGSWGDMKNLKLVSMCFPMMAKDAEHFKNTH